MRIFFFGFPFPAGSGNKSQRVEYEAKDYGAYALQECIRTIPPNTVLRACVSCLADNKQRRLRKLVPEEPSTKIEIQLESAHLQRKILPYTLCP